MALKHVQTVLPALVLITLKDQSSVKNRNHIAVVYDISQLSILSWNCVNSIVSAQPRIEDVESFPFIQRVLYCSASSFSFGKLTAFATHPDYQSTSIN